MCFWKIFFLVRLSLFSSEQKKTIAQCHPPSTIWLKGRLTFRPCKSLCFLLLKRHAKWNIQVQGSREVQITRHFKTTFTSWTHLFLVQRSDGGRLQTASSPQISGARPVNRFAGLKERGLTMHLSLSEQQAMSIRLHLPSNCAKTRISTHSLRR
jgi:hypothetical protein